MSELSGLYAVWEREFRIFLREKSRIAGSAISPLLWLFIFGGGLGAQFSVGSLNYQVFIYPGVVVMTVLFSSIFYGLYVVWDKRLDFLKEVLVAPLNRGTIFLGKVLGGVTDGLVQATILLVLSPFFGISPSINLAIVYLVLFILVTGLVGIGLTIGSLMESPEGFGFVVSILNFPLFFLSGALYPLKNLPSWLSAFTGLNPVTYGVDAVRGLMLGTHSFELWFDFLSVTLFSLIMLAVGTLAFRRMKL